MSEQVSFIAIKMKRRRGRQLPIPPACLVMTAAHDECDGNAKPGGRCRARTPRYGLGSLPLLLSILTIHRHITCQVVLGFSPLAATLRQSRANTSNMRAAPVPVALLAKKKKSAAATKVIEIEQDDEEEALYWRVDTDEFAFTDDVDENGERSSATTTSATKKLLKFTVRGKPVPLRRHRTSRGFMYNPSAKMQMEFRQVVSDMIYPTVPPSSVEEYIESSSVQQPEPIFREDEEEALYWRVDTDEFAFTDDVDENGERSSATTTSATKKLLKFTVRGKPVPLRRHRTSRGFMYNPSAKMQMEFRQVVSDMIYPTVPPSSVEEYIESSSAQQPEPIFKEDEYLAVTLLFRLKRPKSHFIGSKPGPGRLRPTSPGKLHTTRTDVDNLAKFVLDSLNDLVYVDDRQIVSLHAIKVLDSEGHCEGATEVMIRRLDESEMESFVTNMGDI